MKWILKKIKVSELKENPKNPRKLTEKGLKDLENSIVKFGVAEPLVCNTDLMICGGHGRKKILERLNIKEVDCYLPDKKLTQKQFDEQRR
jgi:ParB-like chromosome segregation protein Spo0J